MPNGRRSRSLGATQLRAGFVLGLTLLCAGTAGAQPPAAQPATPPPVSALLNATPTSDTFAFTYFNRPIVTLKAIVLGRSPRERAVGAERALDDLVAQGITGPVTSQLFDSGALISVGPRVVLALTSGDIDNLSGETIQGVSSQTVARLQQALNEASEARTPRALLRSAAMALLAVVVGLAALWGIGRVRRIVAPMLVTATEKTAAKSKIADVELLRGIHISDFERRLLTALTMVLNLIIVYGILAFCLRQFPYTRPWGESLRGFLWLTAQNVSLATARALPGLFMAALVFLATRFVTRVIGLWFNAVARGRVSPRWIHPETAEPTRRLATAMAWLFAIVVAYPYLPGSDTQAFKGVSVFLGLLVTFGSSGLVSQIVSGFTITYSRALRLGDFVRIGDVEGTVNHLGVLSTKLRTLWNEDVTIPNAVVVAQTTTDYSRFGNTDGVFTPTSITIGYDTPWRQVHALLLQAAERTADLRRHPKPFVLQEALEDVYVKYTLLVSLVRQETRPYTLNALHANIQDLFNEYGVQIMSPSYEADPPQPKVVPREGWYAAPAVPPASEEGNVAAT
jgi:small-conductance mechanosensitive channel